MICVNSIWNDLITVLYVLRTVMIKNPFNGVFWFCASKKSVFTNVSFALFANETFVKTDFLLAQNQNLHFLTFEICCFFYAAILAYVFALQAV